jgi:hypothetical protein
MRYDTAYQIVLPMIFIAKARILTDNKTCEDPRGHLIFNLNKAQHEQKPFSRRRSLVCFHCVFEVSCA